MKTRLVALLIVFAFLLSGCVQWLFFYRETPYEFRQDTDRIVSIEILKHDPSYDLDNASVLMTIDPSRHQEVVDGLLEIPGGRVGMDPPWGFGTYFFRITYQDGECELIGECNNGYIMPDGTLRQTNYSFEKEPFDEFLSGFLGRTITD